MSTHADSMILNQNKFDVLHVLKSVPLLSGLTTLERSQLTQGLTKTQYKQDEYIMHEGDEGDSFYIIVSGRVSVLVGPKSECIGTLTSGDYCGEQALLQNSTRNASLQCISPTVQCLVCKQDIFRSILENNSSVQFAERRPQRNAFVSNYNHNNDDIKIDNESMDTQTINWLLGCVANNALFKELSIEEKKNIFFYMKLVNIALNECVILQGDCDEKASTFYIVSDGEYDTFIDNVRRPSAHYSRGGWFGELALLLNSPRAASIKCVSLNGGKLWEISRKHFRLALSNLQKRKMKENIEFLKSVDLFKPLLNSELCNLNDALETLVYINRDDQVVYKQGDVADNFYVIKKGKIKWSKSNGENGILVEGEFFGERALRTKNPRAATISIATDRKTVLLSMSGNDFEELLGPVIQIIDDKIKQYKRCDVDVDVDEKKDLEEKESNEDDICSLSELITLGILGKGGFGLVTLVEDPNTNNTYALKAIKKYQIIENNLQQHIISEKLVMKELNNKFLVNLHKTYKDQLRVYFLLDACLGGELFTILRNQRYFNQKTARFYAASVIEGFDYMHSKDIIYRDMKPENLVLDSVGYLKIADFGFAKKITDKTYTFCGTPDYLCPEIITGQGHGKGVDWWCLGILIYEMLASFAPFEAEEPIQTYRKILKGKIRFPKFFSREVRDLICKLLQHRPTKRYGVLKGGARKIRKHVWFKSFKWDMLYDGSMKPPIVNKVKSKKDLANFSMQQKHKIDDYAQAIEPQDEFDELF